MIRTADSTIKGFLYQFNKTIISIAEAIAGEEVTVEGLVEDIDIESIDGDIIAVQCKYHESVEKFTDSLIYKPILQMAEAFSKSPQKKIKYKIYIHVPSEPGRLTNISVATLEAAIATTDQKLSKISARIVHPLNKKDFLNNLVVEFGPSIDDLEKNAKILLSQFDIPDSDVDCILYPNAINYIAKISSLRDDSKRKIRRMAFQKILTNINFAGISKWVLASKNKKEILRAMQKQLSNGLSQNNRERAFYFSPKSIAGFDDDIVIFIDNYIKKYSYKTAHTTIPVISVDCDLSEILQLQLRLYKKGIKANTGIVGTELVSVELFRAPMRINASAGTVKKEFDICIFSSKPDMKYVNQKKSSDLFCICDVIPSEIDSADLNVVQLGVKSFTELEYILQLRGSYE